MDQGKAVSYHASLNKMLQNLTETDPMLLIRSLGYMGRSSLIKNSGTMLDQYSREEISKINYISNLDGSKRNSSVQTVPDVSRENVAGDMATNTDGQLEEDVMKSEQFPVNVTSLMNEQNYWGCFYNFPEIYEDANSPVVRLRTLADVPEIVGGVLTRDVISACLTYLRRIPILGDYVFIKLDLSRKHLINIEVLQHYKYLVYLDLSYNYLTNLTVLSNLLYLQFLSVSYNRLSTVLEYETPQWFLTEVNYKYNSLKRIRDLTMFWSITILDLSHNNIKCISGLENLSYLRHLDLSFNHIQRLENLNHLRLAWLDLSYNNISSFEFSPSTGMWTLLHLEYLNMNDNNLTSIKIFSGCTRLKQLLARNNRLNTLLELAVYMRQMRRLNVLDLRGNPICSTPGYKEVAVNTFPLLLNLDSQQIDPVEQAFLKMDVNPDVNVFACRRLLRLLYIEQLSRARVSPAVPPADTTDIPMIIIVGEEAVGKGTLARRLATECSSKVELAIQHTTSEYHFNGHYKEVTRSKFDDKLLAGEFLTYTEMFGESYGLSREEAFIRDGKVRVACMDLTSALMMKLRGRKPYLILANYLNKTVLQAKQKERKDHRDMTFESKTSIEVPMDKSTTLQVLVSGRILVTGILNEILLTLPEEKAQSEFLLESECSLLMDSDIRRTVQEYAKGINMLELLCPSCSSVQNTTKSREMMIESSLWSLYKESQGTAEYVSDPGIMAYSIQGSRRSAADALQKVSELLHSKNMEFKGAASGYGSAKSAKSVTFTLQNADTYTSKDIIDGLYVEEFKEIENKNTPRSMSKKFPWVGANCTFDDGDLWLSFLVDTGLLQGSESNVEYSETTPTKHQAKVDDPEHILKLLAIYRTIRSQTFTTNIRDGYEEIHRNSPGFFWDTITMDDPEAAFKKAKKILRAIFEAQKDLKPMFDIDFAKNSNVCPLLEERITHMAKYIGQERFFF